MIKKNNFDNFEYTIKTIKKEMQEKKVWENSQNWC